MTRIANIRILLAATCLLLACSARADADDAALRLRAAFVLNFLKFAEWPEHVPGDADEPFVFVIIGGNGMTETLQSTFENRTLVGRPIVVRSLRNEEPLAADTMQCQALYIEVSPRTNWHAIRRALGDRPVLTIAEMPDFCLEGGMLNLVQVEDRIRFEANPDAARQAGVKLRAELLNLAIIVDTRKESGR